MLCTCSQNNCLVAMIFCHLLFSFTQLLFAVGGQPQHFSAGTIFKKQHDWVSVFSIHSETVWWYANVLSGFMGVRNDAQMSIGIISRKANGVQNISKCIRRFVQILTVKLSLLGSVHLLQIKVMLSSMKTSLLLERFRGEVRTQENIVYWLVAGSTFLLKFYAIYIRLDYVNPSIQLDPRIKFPVLAWHQ